MELSNRFEILIKKIYYINERYNVDATFALLYHEHPLDVNTLGDMIRRSDEIIEVDAHHYFLVFAFTSQTNAIKACENLLQKLDHHFNDRSTSIALDSFDTSRTPQSVLNRLMQILEETRKHSFMRIENEEILDCRM